MKFRSSSSKTPETEQLDLLVYGVFEKDQLNKKALLEGFKAKSGEIFYTHPDKGPRAVAHMGLGEKAKATPDTYRKTGAQACKLARSEERRVGKECRSRWSPDH